VAVLAVVLADRAPLALAQIRAPSIPIAGVQQPVLELAETVDSGALRSTHRGDRRPAPGEPASPERDDLGTLRRRYRADRRLCLEIVRSATPVVITSSAVSAISPVALLSPVAGRKPDAGGVVGGASGGDGASTSTALAIWTVTVALAGMTTCWTA